MNAKAIVHSFIASLLLTASPLIIAKTYTVTSNADTDGNVCGVDCTLRQAINAANLNSGTDKIKFDLDNTLITLSSPLPDITERLKINGANKGDSDSESSDSSDDSNNVDRVVLDGDAFSIAGVDNCGISTRDGARIMHFNGKDASKSEVKNLHFQNMCVGIRLTGSLGDGVTFASIDPIKKIKIKNNVFRNVIGNGAVEAIYDQGTVFNKNNTAAPYEGYGCQDITVKDNVFDGTLDPGTTQGVAGVFLHCHRATFKNNICESLSGGCVASLNFNGGAPYERLDSPLNVLKDITVENNKINQIGDTTIRFFGFRSGIPFNGSDVVIKDNTITNTVVPFDGISMFNFQNAKVLDNDIDSATRGITIIAGKGIHIVDNNISNIGRQCIEAFGFSNGNIIGNNISSCSLTGGGLTSILMVPAGPGVFGSNNIARVSVNNNLIKGNTFDNTAFPNAAIFMQTSVSVGVFGDVQGTLNNNKFVNNSFQGVAGPVDVTSIFPPGIVTPTRGGAIVLGDELSCEEVCEALNNTIIGNRTFNNAGHGIELTNKFAPFLFDFSVSAADFLAPNLTEDGGVQVNLGVAAPVVDSATAVDDDELRIVGNLESNNNTTYRIDVYLSDANNTNQQSQYHVGHYLVTTDNVGNASINRTIDVDDDQFPNDDINLNELYITTTATELLVVSNNDDDDSSSSSSSSSSANDYSHLGATSELSEVVEVN